MAPSPVRRRPVGWVIAAVLFGIYVSLKLQSGWFSFQAHRLEQRLNTLRPELTSLVMYEQLKITHAACLQALGEARGSELTAQPFLQQLSETLPPSITIERLELSQAMGLKVRGSCLPGIRPPEEPILGWAGRLRREGFEVQVKSLTPDPKVTGLWRFELKGEKTRG